MKVPIESDDEARKAAQDATEGKAPAADAAPAGEGAAAVDAAPAQADAEELSPEEEAARVEAAIRAGEEAAERELAADASKIREERDALLSQLADAQEEAIAAQHSATEAQDKFLRLQADWDNYRRRTATERLAERERAAEKLVVALLPVIDDVERAIEHAPASDAGSEVSQFVDGIQAVHDKLVDVLSREGVEVIDPAGQPFEPLSHQAVGRVEDKDAYDETVAQVYQKGYSMGGKVIRTAMVTVTYGGPKCPAPKDE